ncbi:MAG: hypothetical protein ACK4RK_04515, partial [Gemmataceae bacterium]
ADFLAQLGKFEHTAEFLKANLRRGIVARPWVQEALALALQESGGAPVDIERAQASAIDLVPNRAESYLQASRALADNQRYDQALALCRQAAQVEPNLPDPYADALVYAEKAVNSEALLWAAGNLLQRDWPVDNRHLHLDAQDRLNYMARLLSDQRQVAEAQKLRDAAKQVQQRDLVITLIWQGEADLDLKVKEPVGTICSSLQRQTPGGGTFHGDDLQNRLREEYVAAQAFSGDYEVTVERIWGRPLGAKATLEIIRHQGSPQESRERHTLVLDNGQKLTFKLDEGRRTALASVPLTLPQRRAETQAGLSAGNRSLIKLRSLVEPEFNNIDEEKLMGGVAGSGFEVPKPITPTQALEHFSYQGKVPSFVNDALDMTAKATVSADGSYVRLTLQPAFETASRLQARPVITNPVIPGSDN